MKVMFLDIDGALDNAFSFFAMGQPNIKYPTDVVFYDPTGLAFVKNLISFGVKIVLIGDRRKGYTLEQLQAKYDFEIFDKTESVSFDIKTDKEHCLDWLKRHPEVEHFVILNTSEHYGMKEHFTVDTFDGLNYKMLIHIVYALGIKDYK